MAVERRTVWLGAALVLALVGFVVVRSMDQGGAPAASSRRNTPTARAGRAGANANADAAVEVNLTLLQRERGEPADGTRNPFRFQPKPAPAPPPSAAAERAANQAAAPIVPAVPAGPPPPPPIALKFIGIVQKADGTRIAVLSDGKRPYYGVEGQDIEGQYRILKVGQESVEIAYIDGRGRQTLRLSGQ